MIICIDAGNSTVSVAFYKSCLSLRPLKFFTTALAEPNLTNRLKTIFDKYAKPHESTAVLCSVIDKKDKPLRSLLKTYNFKAIIEVSNRTAAGMLDFDVKHPNKVGADRIAVAVAISSVTSANACIVDFGTATTISVLLEGKRFAGGAILPGLQTMAKSLGDATARLPLVKLTNPKTALGTDTHSAITSGIIYGTAGAVERIMSEIEQEINSPVQLFITGGNAKYIQPVLMRKHTWIPDLIFRGMLRFVSPVKQEFKHQASL